MLLSRCMQPLKPRSGQPISHRTPPVRPPHPLPGRTPIHRPPAGDDRNGDRPDAEQCHTRCGGSGERRGRRGCAIKGARPRPTQDGRWHERCAGQGAARVRLCRRATAPGQGSRPAPDQELGPDRRRQIIAGVTAVLPAEPSGPVSRGRLSMKAAHFQHLGTEVPQSRQEPLQRCLIRKDTVDHGSDRLHRSTELLEVEQCLRWECPRHADLVVMRGSQRMPPGCFRGRCRS